MTLYIGDEWIYVCCVIWLIAVYEYNSIFLYVYEFNQIEQNAGQFDLFG